MTSGSFRSLVKKAAVTTDPRVDLAKQLLSVGAAGLGAGAAARALVGLRNLGRPPVQTPFISPGPSAIPIPVPAPQVDDVGGEESPEEEANLKFAAGETSGPFESAAQGLAQFMPRSSWGREAASIPGTVLTGGAALMGGWKLTDMLLDNRRKAQLQEELDMAKKEYEGALHGTMGAKLASNDKVGVGLDQLFDGLSKEGSVTAKATGAYALAAALMAGGAGVGAYNWTKGRSEAALLAKAQKERARRLWSSNLQPVYAVPEPVEMPNASAA